jgi:hypothetical protein
MPKVELVFFAGCPNIERAKSAIRAAGLDQFLEVDQAEIESDHPYRKLSSPTILIDGEIVVGSNSSSPACSIINWAAAIECLRGK